MHFTYFGSNSWLINLAGYSILIDPWLVGDLSFGGATWFFNGKLNSTPPRPTAIDLILLSQGLADHAHEPTLKTLDRSIPVVGSHSAAKVAQRLGYTQVTALSPGERHTLERVDGEPLDIIAVPGAPVPQIENGYILTATTTQQKIYYEPHGFFDSNLKTHAPVDVLITPVVNLELPWVGPIINGKNAAPELVKLLHPKRVLPTATGGDVTFTGILMNLLQTQGTLEDFERHLQAVGYPVQCNFLQAGETLTLESSS